MNIFTLFNALLVKIVHPIIPLDLRLEVDLGLFLKDSVKIDTLKKRMTPYLLLPFRPQPRTPILRQ